MSPTKKDTGQSRLRNKTVVKALFASGKTVQTPALILRYQMDSRVDRRYIGVAVSKRKFKRAVDRNRIKRQMRAALKAIENIGHQTGSFMLIYHGDKKPETHQLITNCMRLFTQINP